MCVCVCVCNSYHKILFKTSVIMINNSRFKVKDNYEGNTNNSSNEINYHNNNIYFNYYYRCLFEFKRCYTCFIGGLVRSN